MTIDRKRGKYCDSDNPFLKLWTRHLFTFAFWLFWQQNNKVLSSIFSDDFLLFSLEQFLSLARTTKYQGYFRFSRAKIWNDLPLDLRSEHHINKFAFGLKRHFRSQPKWAFLTFVILSCTIFLSVFCCVCCFFFFIWVPFRPASLNWAPPSKYCLK